MPLYNPKSDIGTLVGGQFQLVRLLGSGTSGAVFEGRDGVTRARVAVKLLHGDLLTSEEHVARFIREARTAARIQHPGVVAFLDAGRHTDGRPYLVQEFLHGETLQDLMDRGELILPQIFELSLQLLEALGAVHEAGLVHRDVKPENVLLFYDEFGDVRIKLVDFGIVKPDSSEGAGEITATGLTVGTPHYMSPEQARGETVDARSDVWAVGVVLFEALTGKLPIDGDSPYVVLARVVAMQPPSVKSKRTDLPDWLVEVVDRALQRKPTKRWQSALEMAEALRQGIRG